VARALLRELAVEAKRRGYPSIYWLLKSWNDAARALYSQAGAEIEEGILFCRLADDALIRWAETAP
jgi:hypothetical protein